VKTMVSRPTDERIGFGSVIRSAKAMMKGAKPIASNWNSDTVSSTKYFRIPASRHAIGAATVASAATKRGSGAVQANPIMTAKSDRQDSVAGHPAMTKNTDASAKWIAALTPASAAIRRDR